MFSALVPPPFAVRGLEERFAAAAEGMRWETSDRWHITLRFYGVDDPRTRAPWLRERLRGAHAPWIRLHGAGTFPRVVFVAVDAEDPTALHGLAKRCGADDEYRPHLTVGRGNVPGAAEAFAEYAGAWFRPSEVSLLASGAGRYTVVDRVRLDRELP